MNPAEEATRSPSSGAPAVVERLMMPVFALPCFERVADSPFAPAYGALSRRSIETVRAQVEAQFSA